MAADRRQTQVHELVELLHLATSLERDMWRSGGDERRTARADIGKTIELIGARIRELSVVAPASA